MIVAVKMPKVKLTPAERREIRRQKKIEKKKRKDEEKRQVKREHLHREVKYGALTLKKYEKDWRQMLIKVTVPRMRQELEFAWHNFERVVDCKDFTISLLMDELRNSEEQYMRNFSHHMENIDKLIEMFGDRMEELKKDYQEEVKSMQERCSTEVENIKDTTNENFNYVKTMLHQLELAKRYQERTKRAEYYSRLDEVEVKNQLHLQKLKATLETKYQNIFNGMKRFVFDYNKQIRERKKDHKKLKDADDAIQELIAQQFRQIKKLYDVIRHLKQKYNDMKQNEGSKLQDLQAERNYFANSLLALKNKLEEDKRNDFQKLKCLSQSSAVTFDCLEKLNKKGEMVLKLAAVCRKLETQKEKIMQFPLNINDIHSQRRKSGDDDEENKGVRKELELFWQRVGQAYGVHFTLHREKKFLKEENQIFIDTHNDYCEKLTYSEIKKFAPTSTFNKVDGNSEMQKYKSTIPELFNRDVLGSRR